MCEKHWKINQLSYSTKSCFNWLLVLNGKWNAFYDSFMSIVVNKHNMKTLIKICLKNHNSFILILYHQKNNELELYSSCEIYLPANTFIDNGNGYHTNKLKFLTKFILDINNFYTSCFGNKQSCSEKNGKNAIHCYRFMQYGYIIGYLQHKWLHEFSEEK